MTVAEATLKEILDIEWDMFHAVENMDGPAECQQDRRTFDIMRSSQISAWNQEVAESYLGDLKRALADGRNLMTEKYARMMEYTSPCEYRRIAPNVPPVATDAEAVVQRLSRLSVRWMEELADKYPYVGGRGRAIHSSEDNKHAPSFETYNRGELATYSEATLRLLEEHFTALEAEGTNAAEIILRRTVEQLGYASLEQAEAAQKARAER